MTRTRDQIRAERLTVMSAALDLFRTRKANLARRDPQMARATRWAGAEAKFCIADTKTRQARDAKIRQAEANIAASNADLISRMTPDQLEDRIRGLLGELERLQYAPWGVNVSARRVAIRKELELLQPVQPGPGTSPAQAVALTAALLAVVS